MMLDEVNEGTTLFAMDPMRKEHITQDPAQIGGAGGRARTATRPEGRGSTWLAAAIPAEVRMSSLASRVIEAEDLD